MRFLLVFLWALLLAAPQARAEGRYFLLKVGAEYEEGDFGSAPAFSALALPMTLRHVWSRGDLGVSVPLLRVETSQGLTLVDGRASRASRSRDRAQETVETGLGDAVIKGRLYLLEDGGGETPTPSVTPVMRLKLPTASRDKNLGTGEADYGFALELEKKLSAAFVFGDIGYTVIGRPSGEDLRDRTAASLGAGREFLERGLSASVELDWRRSIVPGAPDPLELLGALNYKLSETMKASPFLFAGLSDGSPDWGAGIGLSVRFGFH